MSLRAMAGGRARCALMLGIETDVTTGPYYGNIETKRQVGGLATSTGEGSEGTFLWSR